MDDIEVVRIGNSGPWRLTMNGLNELRRRVGLPPIKPEPGEAIEAYKDRARRMRREFFENYGHLWPEDCVGE